MKDARVPQSSAEYGNCRLLDMIGQSPRRSNGLTSSTLDGHSVMDLITAATTQAA